MKKKIAAGCLALSLFAGALPVSAYQSRLTPYNDVPQNSWESKPIYALSALSVIDGYEDGLYHPGEQVSREAFIKLLAAASKQTAAPDHQPAYTDVQPDRWSYPFIYTAKSLHWIDFMSANGVFSPAKSITREEAAAAIGSYLLSLPGAQSSWEEADWKAESGARGFADATRISAEIARSVYFTVHRNIMEGDDTGFRPQDGLTRREAAAIIYRLLDQETSDIPLQVNGFYALGSYPSLNQTPNLDVLTLGWSHLEYSSPGTATAATTGGDYSIPAGWEEVVRKAVDSGKPLRLMVFAEGDSLVSFLQDKQAQQAFYDSVSRLVGDAKYHLDGLCIDFEGLKAESSAPEFNDFLRGLKTVLNGKALSVAVPPVFNYKGYDLPAIAELADEMVVMAYNFTHKDSRLPSAPLPLVDETLKSLQKLNLPMDKIVLGISKKTDQWIQSAAGGTELAHPKTTQVEERLQKTGVNSQFALPYFLERIIFQDDRGSHEIYYEDSQSIGMKLWLAKYYGLKGVSLWTMGALTDDDWKTVVQSARP